ncbi:MAG TPA: tetratricopeptide repeat protein [Thermoanaerobaculia bacterium]
MKKLLLVALASLSLAGCLSIQQRLDRARFGENPYLEPPFYARYLTGASALDRNIEAYIVALRAEPDNPAYHNELGRLLVIKRFPQDAEREFRRALAADEDFYPAWYNLALLRASRGDAGGAIRALDRTLELKPGHSSALFQKGLLLEKRGRKDEAIDAYVKALRINFDLIRPTLNPLVIDSKLMDRVLIELYPDEHERRAMLLQPTPPELVPRRPAPSEVERPEAIVPPTDQTEPQPPATTAPPTSTTTPPPGW